MSTHVSITCTTCHASSESSNHGEQAAALAIKAAPLLRQLMQMQYVGRTWVVDVDVKIGYDQDFADFAEQHCGHTMIIEDEYGYQGRTMEEYRESYQQNRYYHLSDQRVPAWESTG